jgi:KaiC/GvpD/RAD55 family RecA-like ATPase
MTKSISFSNVFVDEVSEWKLLAALLDPKNAVYLHRINEVMFTEERVIVFRALRDTFTQYGSLDLRGLSLHLKGEVPGELLASHTTSIAAVFDDCVRLATKRVARQKAEEFEFIASQFSPSDGDIMRSLSFHAVGAGEDSSTTGGAVEFLGNLHAKLGKKYRFASTGMPWLDIRMGGEWKPKAFIVLAAGPGGGKTTLVANSMLEMARQVNTNGDHDPTPSLFFSLEMSKEDLFVKWIADTLSIDSRYIASGRLTPEQTQDIERVVTTLQKLPMYVIDNGKITLYKMVKEIREHVIQNGVRVVFLDYIQIVNHNPTGNTNSDLGEVAETLKALAKELNITIVALSQLNRNGQGLDGIRDSGEIAQVADVVFLLNPDDTNTEVRNVEVNFLKNRFGPIGTTSILFCGPYQRFKGMDV